MVLTTIILGVSGFINFNNTAKRILKQNTSNKVGYTEPVEEDEPLSIIGLIIYVIMMIFIIVCIIGYLIFHFMTFYDVIKNCDNKLLHILLFLLIPGYDMIYVSLRQKDEICIN